MLNNVIDFLKWIASGDFLADWILHSMGRSTVHGADMWLRNPRHGA